MPNPPKVSREQLDELVRLRPDSMDEEDARNILLTAASEGGWDVEMRPIAEIEAQGKAQWAQQNPRTAKLEGASKTVQNALQPVGAAMQGLDRVLAQDTILGPSLGLIAGTGQVIAGGLKRFSDKADQIDVNAGNPQYNQSVEHGAANLFRTGADAAEMFVPTDRASALMMMASPSATKKNVAPLVRDSVHGALDGIEGFLSKFPSAKLELDKPRARAAMTAEESVRQAVMAEQMANRERIGGAFKKAESEMPGRFGDEPNPQEYGGKLISGMRLDETAMKRALSEKSKPIMEQLRDTRTDVSAEFSATLDNLKTDLTGILETSTEGSVKRLLDKYVRKEVDYGSGGLAPLDNVRLSDMVKDRSLLHEQIERFRNKADGRHTPESRALIQLSHGIGEEIESALKGAGKDELLKSFKENRGEWRQFYKQYYSDTAVGMKKGLPSEVNKAIFSSMEAMDEAKTALGPKAWQEAVKVHTFEIMEGLDRAPDKIAYVNKYKTGWLEKLYGEGAKAKFTKFAELYPQYKEINDLVGEIQSRSGINPETRRRVDSLEQAYMRRQEDTVKEARWSKRFMMTGGVASMWWMTHNPVLAVLAGTIGYAPEILAKAYVKGSQPLRNAIDTYTRTRAHLGVNAPVHSQVATVIEQMGAAGINPEKKYVFFGPNSSPTVNRTPPPTIEQEPSGENQKPLNGNFIDKLKKEARTPVEGTWSVGTVQAFDKEQVGEHGPDGWPGLTVDPDGKYILNGEEIPSEHQRMIDDNQLTQGQYESWLSIPGRKD